MDTNETEDMSDTTKLLNNPDQTSKTQKDDDIVGDMKSYVHAIKGLTAVLLDVLSMVVAASSVQLLERSIPDFELNVFRYCTALVANGVMMVAVRREWPVIKAAEIPSTLGFCCLSFLTSVCLYVAVTLVPVSSVESLRITSAIISGTVLFAVLGEENISRRYTIPALMCCTGVLLVIQPDFIFKTLGMDSHKNTTLQSNLARSTVAPCLNCTKPGYNNKEEIPFVISSWQSILGYCLPVITGTGVTFTLILLKRRPYLTLNMPHVLLWSFIMGAIFSAVLMAAFESPVLPSGWKQLLFVSTHCLCFPIGWPLLLYAVQFISGNTINIVNSTSVVLMLVPQYTMLSSILPGRRNWVEVVGAAMVLAGSVLGSVMETLQVKKKR